MLTYQLRMYALVAILSTAFYQDDTVRLIFLGKLLTCIKSKHGGGEKETLPVSKSTWLVDLLTFLSAGRLGHPTQGRAEGWFLTEKNSPDLTAPPP